MEILLLIIYIIVSVLIFLSVSKMNGSYLNSYSLKTGITIIMRLIPFVISIFIFGERQYSGVFPIFIFSLFISLILSYLGYRKGFKYAIKIDSFKALPSYLQLNTIFIASTLMMVISFVLLGVKGVGVSEWIFNNRYAYIVGRKGLGIYYILFQLMIITSLVAVLTKSNTKRKISKLVIIPVLASYFTGSKGFLLGIILTIVFFYDFKIKRIKMSRLIFLAFTSVIVMQLLLMYQSNTNILDYAGSDYYKNYLKLIEYFKMNSSNFYWGRLTLEEFFWNLVPRELYNNKPFVYGHSVIVEIFYGRESIISGHTPSFTELAVPYADAGLIGIATISAISGYFNGIIEKTLRHNFKKVGVTFVTYFIYVILYIVGPANFSGIYLTIFVLILIIFIHTKLRKVTIQ